MNKAEKIMTWIVAVIGAITGSWATYTNFSESEFKKPITLRTAMVNSFKSQIESAKERGDNDEVVRVRKIFENYEEKWRGRYSLSFLTEPIKQLKTINLNPEDKARLIEILNNSDFQYAKAEFDPLTVGSAYLATAAYKKASDYFRVAAEHDPTNANVVVLKSLALLGEAKTSELKHELEQLRVQIDQLNLKAVRLGADSKSIKKLSAEIAANK
jgi:uncharacterized protein HemY